MVIDIVVGKKISCEEFKARWAYSELTSDRFAHMYEKPGTEALFDKARRGVPFDDLSSDEKRQLVAMITQCADRAGLLPALNGFRHLVCEPWTKEQLLETVTVPGLRWRPFRDFINEPSSSSGNPLDPRVVTEKIPSTQKFNQTEPICVVPLWRYAIMGPAPSP